MVSLKDYKLFISSDTSPEATGSNTKSS